MRIKYPEKKKEEKTPLVSGGVYRLLDGTVYILCEDQQYGDWRFVRVSNGAAIACFPADPEKAAESVSGMTYFPDATLVLEPKE